MTRFSTCISILLISAAAALAQETQVSAETVVEELLPEAGKAKLEPVFPTESNALIYIEAEDAVSTNFAKDPTLNYGASGYRTLQLNRYTGLYGGASFFAEFVFYAEEDGTYELWYGGTPPGPAEDVYPSYASPFSYRIDNRNPVSVHWEDVIVASGYTPSFYWVRVGLVDLKAGIHTIRYEVAEKRRFDGKFYFFLDSLFLIDRNRFDISADPAPEVFPPDLTRNDLDSPFLSISDYEYLITQSPDDPEVYIELSLIYSLIGDYNNALKNLSRAALTAPSNIEVQLLAAKNRLWKGDAAEGLRAYERLLQLDPEQPAIWAEAGKVAAWIGKYRDSIQFYRSGLRQYPEDLNLIVNLGITYLWDNQAEQANLMFKRAREVAGDDIAAIVHLGNIYMVNGYPDEAIDTFREAIRAIPEYLVLYLKLEQAFGQVGRVEDAEKVHGQIADRFVESGKLLSYLDTFGTKQRMKDSVILTYQTRLEKEPDNLNLRELLVQTYFWNGLRQRAIDESLNILTNYAYRAFTEFDSRNSDLLSLIDRFYLFKRFFEFLPGMASTYRKKVTDSLSRYEQAERENDRYLATVARAKEKGEDPPTIEGTHPTEALFEAENELADAVRFAETFIAWAFENTDNLGDMGALVDPIIEHERQDKQAFSQVTLAIGWTWDRRAAVSELEAVSSARGILADHVLARIYQFERNYPLADRYADRALSPTTLLVPTIYGLKQTALWAHGENVSIPYDPEAPFAVYQSYVVETNRLALQLAEPPSVGRGFFAASTLDRADSILSELDEVRRQAAGPLGSVGDGLELLHGVIENRMRRLWFQIDQDTYLLRFELGDYYLAEEQYRPAIAEFQKVLAIDPWNTSAKFKLGMLHQLSGNWRQAMARYQQVYFADPRFENVAGNYNYLARQHADSLAFENYVMADSSRVAYHAEASFTNNLNGATGFDVSLASDTIRRFQAYGGVLPDTYQVHELVMALPITISGLQLTIKPEAGIAFSPELLTDSVSTPQEASDPAGILGSFSPELMLGANLGLNAGPVYLGGVYRYGRVYDTFFPSTDRVVAHSGELNAVLSFGFLEVPLLQYSSARAYAKADYRLHADGTDNLMLTLAQDLTQVFHLSDTPWTNLTVSASAIFERATDTTVDDYFAPDNVLNLKGGVSLATWIGVGNGNVLGLSLRFDAGLYTPQILDPPVTNNLSTSAEGRVEYTKGDSTYYATLFATATFSGFPDPDYWSTYLRLGYTAKLPRLLAD